MRQAALGDSNAWKETLPLKVLKVYKEFADLILSGKKVWEIRSSPTKNRGRIGISPLGLQASIGTVAILASLNRNYCSDQSLCLVEVIAVFKSFIITVIAPLTCRWLQIPPGQPLAL